LFVWQLSARSRCHLGEITQVSPLPHPARGMWHPRNPFLGFLAYFHTAIVH
jgi:hypothetical protein